MKTLLLTLLLLTGLAQAQELHTQIFPSYRAEELLPILRPLVEPAGSVNAYQGQLVIRASAGQLAQIAGLLQQLDRPLRTVQISVRRQGSERQQARGVNTDIRLRYPQGSRIGVDIRDSQQQQHSDSTHSSRVLENSSTFIDTGSALAMPVYQYGPGGVIVGQSYQSLMQGFEATPRILPDGRVQLDIHYRHEQAQGRRQIDSQSADSVLLLQPGQWTPLGGVSESHQSQHRGILSQGSSQHSRELPLEVRVDILD